MMTVKIGLRSRYLTPVTFPSSPSHVYRELRQQLEACEAPPPVLEDRPRRTAAALKAATRSRVSSLPPERLRLHPPGVWEVKSISAIYYTEM